MKLDRYWFNDTSRDDSWDAIWDVSVSRDSEGWTAEFRIPFSQLRFNRDQSNTFGFSVQRRIGRFNETSTWPLLSRSAPGYVSSFGELAGLATAASPKKLEIVPEEVFVGVLATSLGRFLENEDAKRQLREVVG